MNELQGSQCLSCSREIEREEDETYGVLFEFINDYTQTSNFVSIKYDRLCIHRKLKAVKE